MPRRPNIVPAPDFAAFRDTLLLRRASPRPPLFDFYVALEHQSAMLGRECRTPADRVEFFRLAGYDYVHAPLGATPMEIIAARQRQHQNGLATHGGNVAVIPSLDAFRRGSWSWLPWADGDLSGLAGQFDRLAAMADAMPESMRLILHVADVFTFAWEMIGFDAMCLATLEEPQFPHAVMDSLARVVHSVVQHAIDRLSDRIGAIFYSDDIAYSEGLMLGPDFFRANLFPVIARLVEMGRTIDAPLIYHSDGRLYPVFDDLAAIGVRGIQPLEPKSMDPLEIKRRWPGKFCLMGNIDLDLMARGTPVQVEAYVRQRIDTLNPGGGYIAGVSNTVPAYVNYDNYVRMIETVFSYDAAACDTGA